ncbi:MAG: hypothetical protein ACKV2O_10685 [Acidimicrobiales bacterium]
MPRALAALPGDLYLHRGEELGLPEVLRPSPAARPASHQAATDHTIRNGMDERAGGGLGSSDPGE